MGKFRKKVVPTVEGLQRKEEQEQLRAAQKNAQSQEKRAESKDKRIAILVFYIAAFLLFVVSVVFFGIDISRTRNYELHYERITGTVVDFYIHGVGRSARISLIISYAYGGNIYILKDPSSFGGLLSSVKNTEKDLFVNPLDPNDAVTVSTAGAFSTVEVALFGLAVFLIVITAFLSGRSYKRRVLFAYLPAVVLSLTFLFLSLLGYPRSGLDTVFARMDGAAGYAVVAGIALVAALIDGIVTRVAKKRSA